MSYYDDVKNTVAALVEFYRPDCEDCQKMEPVMEDVKRRATGSVQVMQVNVAEHPATAEREHLTELPAFAVYRYGRCHWRASGIVSADELLARLEAAADPTPANELGHHHARSHEL